MAAKGGSHRGASTNNAALSKLKTAQANADKAQAKADAARAKANLVRANIEASGKQVVWDPKTGGQKVINR